MGQVKEERLGPPKPQRPAYRRTPRRVQTNKDPSRTRMSLKELSLARAFHGALCPYSKDMLESRATGPGGAGGHFAA